MGFSLNGKHSSELGLEVENINRPILPKIRQNYITIGGKDGTYDFGDNTLEDRIIELECGWLSKSDLEIRQKSHEIAAFLYSNTSMNLRFDDEPNVYYRAKLNNQLDLQRTAMISKFTLQFRCSPLALSLNTKKTEFNITSQGQIIKVNNLGTYNTKPIIYMTATANFNNIIINHDYGDFIWGDKTQTSGTLLNGKTLKIDSEFMIVTNNNINALHVQRGYFPILSDGINNIIISNFTGKLIIEYRERWI